MKNKGSTFINGWVILFLLSIVVGCRKKTDTGILLTDDFENSCLADFWRPGDKGSGRYEKDAVSITDQFHRSGTHCVKLVLKEGYIRQDGGDGNFTERTELDSRAHPFLNQKVWYKFSVLIPQDFPVIDDRLVISQVKQTVLSGNSLQLYAQRYRNGQHCLTVYDMTSDNKKEAACFNLPELTKEQWHDFVFMICYSDKADGYINMWMDGKKIASFNGPTASKKGRNQFYHKIGLYRDQYPEPMTIYFDNYVLTNDTLLISPADTLTGSGTLSGYHSPNPRLFSYRGIVIWDGNSPLTTRNKVCTTALK